jgi:hypothetical protein
MKFLREMQRKARATLAAAATAPVIAAGTPSYTSAAEDHHLAGMHPTLLAAAAEAATEAATAALQPQPMDVDWNHPEDVAGAVWLWEPAQQQAKAAYADSLQAAKDRAAQLAGRVQGSAGEGASQEAAATAGTTAVAGPAAGTSLGAAGASSSKGTAARGSSAYLQEQIGVLMGFIKADSCPAISAAEEASLGIKMPRPLAVVHRYSSAAPAAGAAAAAVAALVPGGGRTYSSSEDFPPAGSVGDVTRVSYGAAQKQQQGMVADLQHKVDQLLRYQKLKDACKAAMDSGGPEAADAVLQAAKAARSWPQGLQLQDPNAWVDFSPTPEMLYREAGGMGSWEEARAQLLPMSRDMPAVAAAVQLGLKLCAAVTGRVEQRLDAWDAEQRLMGGEPTEPTEAAGFDAGLDVAALVAEVLPVDLPMRARENALLAFRWVAGHSLCEW